MLDATGLIVSPGMVDAHTHISEPGRTHWEGYETGTRAAAKGGITTMIEMPLNQLLKRRSIVRRLNSSLTRQKVN